MSASSRVDRTAMFVGDRVTYTVDITCRRGTDILLDDVAPDKLKVEGDVVSSQTERREDAGQTRYELRYVLTTYRVDEAALKVAAFDVRYYVRRAGQQVEGTTPAGSVQVPGAAIALRSALTEGEGWHEVRDGRAPEGRPALLRSLGSIGLGLIVLSIAPVALLGIDLARRMHQGRSAVAQRAKRQSRQEVRNDLAAVRDASVERLEARREAFARLDSLVRRHLADTAHVPAMSLTAAEIGAALAARPSRAPAATIASILDTCEAAKYGPAELVPSADAWRVTLTRAEELLGI